MVCLALLFLILSIQIMHSQLFCTEAGTIRFEGEQVIGAYAQHGNVQIQENTVSRNGFPQGLNLVKSTLNEIYTIIYSS
jgi:hypothetical protein